MTKGNPATGWICAKKKPKLRQTLLVSPFAKGSRSRAVVHGAARLNPSKATLRRPNVSDGALPDFLASRLTLRNQTLQDNICQPFQHGSCASKDEPETNGGEDPAESQAGIALDPKTPNVRGLPEDLDELSCVYIYQVSSTPNGPEMGSDQTQATSDGTMDDMGLTENDSPDQIWPMKPAWTECDTLDARPADATDGPAWLLKDMMLQSPPLVDTQASLFSINLGFDI
ncbi:hypothetical protein BC832DRAFT_592483 [Gaertneriomyces semiglobifer]|nr:hypothetical protein BC832DRAFT_592483 [Gaertneriomyces semiglobifer]